MNCQGKLRVNVFKTTYKGRFWNTFVLRKEPTMKAKKPGISLDNIQAEI